MQHATQQKRRKGETNNSSIASPFCNGFVRLIVEVYQWTASGWRDLFIASQ